MDRSSLGLLNADNRPAVVSYITIHRNSLLSDSYTELAGISSRCLKGVIRVKFINEQVFIQFVDFKYLTCLVRGWRRLVLMRLVCSKSSLKKWSKKHSTLTWDSSRFK